MKRIFLLFSLIGFGIATAQAQSIELPDKYKKLLDKNLSGWQFAKVPEEVSKYFQEKKFSFKPNLVEGDWNGDGKIDFAVLIERGNLYNFRSEAIGKQRFVVVFVSGKRNFKYFRFEGSEYIALIKKGLQGYDYQTDKKFPYKTDAIFNGFWEKAGVSYVWEKGKFRTISTSD